MYENLKVINLDVLNFHTLEHVAVVDSRFRLLNYLDTFFYKHLISLSKHYHMEKVNERNSFLDKTVKTLISLTFLDDVIELKFNFNLRAVWFETEMTYVWRLCQQSRT